MSMQSDSFENWCSGILYLSYTLYTLASLQDNSSVNSEVFDYILGPLKDNYFLAVDILTTMGCNISDFLDSTEVSYITFYKTTIEILNTLPQSGPFTDLELKQLVLELETKQDEEFDMRSKHYL